MRRGTFARLLELIYVSVCRMEDSGVRRKDLREPGSARPPVVDVRRHPRACCRISGDLHIAKRTLVVRRAPTHGHERLGAQTPSRSCVASRGCRDLVWVRVPRFRAGGFPRPRSDWKGDAEHPNARRQPGSLRPLPTRAAPRLNPLIRCSEHVGRPVCSVCGARRRGCLPLAAVRRTAQLPLARAPTLDLDLP